jgi:hypothetical protein
MAKNLEDMSKAELLAHVKEVEAKVPAPQAIKCKVSPKGACSVYGLQRFPVTLYANQWKRLLDTERSNILSFIEANKATLKTK